ncbi:hypothetical protein D6817_00900 [Candidatus Pacearchaeota archaeon]|nr:MAG: hypothetical protein D6817_00900 [Candidatus Pacearchaeota archaeon]
MRKIESVLEREKKAQRNRLILSIIMLGILVLSTLGFGLIFAVNYGGGFNTGNNQQANSHGGMLNSNGVLNLGSQQYTLAYPKTQVGDVQVSLTKTISQLSGQTLYIAADNPAVVNELAQTLGRFAARAQEACYQKCDKDLPEKTCDDNLIVWRDSEENKVWEEGNCIFIEGDMRAVDALIYKMLGQ